MRQLPQFRIGEEESLPHHLVVELQAAAAEGDHHLGDRTADRDDADIRRQEPPERRRCGLYRARTGLCEPRRYVVHRATVAQLLMSTMPVAAGEEDREPFSPAPRQRQDDVRRSHPGGGTYGPIGSERATMSLYSALPPSVGTKQVPGPCRLPSVSPASSVAWMVV